MKSLHILFQLIDSNNKFQRSYNIKMEFKLFRLILPSTQKTKNSHLLYYLWCRETLHDLQTWYLAPKIWKVNFEIKFRLQWIHDSSRYNFPSQNSLLMSINTFMKWKKCEKMSLRFTFKNHDYWVYVLHSQSPQVTIYL